MNFRLLSKLLGIVALLIGGTMVLSLFWAHPALGHRHGIEATSFETRGALALIISIMISFGVGALLLWIGRHAEGRLFRKEAMAVVGLSWMLATILGALPFYLAGCVRSPAVRVMGEERELRVFDVAGWSWRDWIEKAPLTPELYHAVATLTDAGARGIPSEKLYEDLTRYSLRLAVSTWLEDVASMAMPEEEEQTLALEFLELIGVPAERRDGLASTLVSRVHLEMDEPWLEGFTDELLDAGVPEELHGQQTMESLYLLCQTDEDWGEVVIFPGDEPAPNGRGENYRIRWIRMGIADCLFESQSGFSTTGATVMSDLEDPELVPHCILFWRSSTHFLGGLGIIVLFVVILGQGSAGKAMMRAEMPGPTKEGSTARMQHTARLFAVIYVGLNVILALILWLVFRMTMFDAWCHAFGTLATGGFSTYNASVGHFNSAGVDYTIIVFMILAGTNFTLLYLVLVLEWRKPLEDVEWLTYIAVIFGVTAAVVVIGLAHNDFGGDTFGARLANSVRYGLFQVVAIITTTGYGTHDFDQWNSFGRGVLFLLMFVGGCAGSTGGGMKVIRHILFFKIMRLEIEQAYHPSVVRPLRLGGKPLDDQDLRKTIMVYFGLILVIFVLSWMFIVTFEPDGTWGNQIEHKLIDSASSVAATLNNIGPGLGTVGATQNYGHFSSLNKILFVWLMMVGRLEIFAILVLFIPSFWRSRG